MAGNGDDSKGENQFDYESDCRTPCKYGAECYQRNPLHQKKFKHPPKRKPQEELNGENKKKAKLETETRKEDDERTTSTNEVTAILNDSGFGTTEDEDADANLSPQERIKKRFLVEMPPDFYSFWDFCKSVKLDSLQIYLGLSLVGPYDILAGKLKPVNPPSAFLRHWRYYFDPPEFMTVIAKTDDDTQFHVGYYRDDPNEMPNFVASNKASENGVINALGPNIFAALNSYIKTQVKDFKSKYTKVHLDDIKALRVKLEKWATENNFTLEIKTASMKARQKAVVSPTFHRAGIVVPVDKKTDVGYRPLPMTDAKLKKLMQLIAESETTEERTENMDKLQEIITLIQFANDECDYGMGLELGMNLFSFGDPVFHPTIRHLLPLAYDLLSRPQYSQIISAHLDDRKKSNLSVLS